VTWGNKLFNHLLSETRTEKARDRDPNRASRGPRKYRYSSGAGDPTVGQQSRPSRGRSDDEVKASKKKGSPHRKRIAGHIKRIRRHYRENPEDKP